MYKLKQLLNTINSKGIPLPILQDLITKKPSITYTMVVISFFMCVFSLVGGITDYVKGIDFQNSFTLFALCIGTYLGRQFQKKGKEYITIEEKNSDEQ